MALVRRMIKMRPTRRLLVAAMSLAALWSIPADRVAAVARPQAPQDRRALEAGRLVERDISLGQTHTYRLTLARGDMLRATIAQRGVDVAAVLVAPDGREVVAVDAMDDEFRHESVTAIADSDGVHTLTVRVVGRYASTGRYAVYVEPPHPATASDRTLVDAERAFASGRRRRDVNDAATWPAALTDFTSALAGYRAADDRPNQLRALIEIAVTENYMGQTEALAPAQEAEQLARALDDRPTTARALRVLASIHMLAGQFAAAARAVEEATLINRAVGNRKAEANSLNYSGNAYRRLGQDERAIAAYEEAMAIARSVHDVSLEANALNNLGIIYSSLGEDGQAGASFGLALTNARASGSLRTQFHALGNLGVHHLRQGRHEAGVPLLREALEIARRMRDPRTEAMALDNLSEASAGASRHHEALDYLRRSIALSQQAGDAINEAGSLIDTGRNWQELGETSLAADALEQALAIGRRLREAHTQSTALRLLAVVERARGDLARARRYIEEAVGIDDAVRGQMISPGLRASYIAARQPRYETFIDVLQELHRRHPDDGHAVAAFEVSERARARVLLESLQDARVDLREGVEPLLLARERALAQQLDEASARLSQQLSSPKPDRGSAAAQTVERLTAEYQRLQAEIREQSPRYAAVTQPRPLSLAQIREAVLDRETVLLEFAIGRERSWLWAVTTDTFESIELPPRRDIDRAARSLYESITARQRRTGEGQRDYARRVTEADARLSEQAASVSQMLLGGIARRLNQEWQGKRLAIVATGALEYLPFAALPLPHTSDAKDAAASAPLNASGRERPRLATAHEVVTLPSASVLAVLRSGNAERRTVQGTLAIVADPVFDGNDPRVRRSASASAPKNAAGATRSLEVLDALHAREGLSRLPFSREEAESLAAMAGAGGVFKAVDFQASRATVLAGGLRGYRIVHLATHGVIDTERPALSSLVLSLVDREGRRQNGYLRLGDIYNTRLDADLVVLSACQTALGKEIRGEGLVGLTRAFFYAGAQRVVASLWQVSDQATAELMQHFYTGMLRQGLSPAAALRAAQAQMAKDPRWASPYFWAGFTLQGEWRGTFRGQ
jgi:CHAT domain-containing protein